MARARGTLVGSPPSTKSHRGYEGDVSFRVANVATPWKSHAADEEEVVDLLSDPIHVPAPRSVELVKRPPAAPCEPQPSEKRRRTSSASGRSVGDDDQGARRGSSAELVFTGTGRELILASGPPTLGVTVGEDKHRLRDATCRWLDVPQLSKTDFKGINAACVALKTLRDGPPPAGRREARWTMNAWEQLSWKGQKLKQVRGGFA